MLTRVIKHGSWSSSDEIIHRVFLSSASSTYSLCVSTANRSSMATLALPPTGAATLPAQEESTATKLAADGSAVDLSDIDSGWVFLGKSDVVPAELAAAAAAAAGHRRLGFSPLPMIPIWVQMMLGGVVYTAVPFYRRARKVEGEAIEKVETALEVLERASEVTEKLAANVANSLPKDGSLQKVVEEVEYIAEEVEKDAHKVEVITKKIEVLSDQIDVAVEPVIEELEKEFKPHRASYAGSDAQK